MRLCERVDSRGIERATRQHASHSLRGRPRAGTHPLHRWAQGCMELTPPPGSLVVRGVERLKGISIFSLLPRKRLNFTNPYDYYGTLLNLDGNFQMLNSLRHLPPHFWGLSVPICILCNSSGELSRVLALKLFSYGFL